MTDSPPYLVRLSKPACSSQNDILAQSCWSLEQEGELRERERVERTFGSGDVMGH